MNGIGTAIMVEIFKKIVAWIIFIAVIALLAFVVYDGFTAEPPEEKKQPAVKVITFDEKGNPIDSIIIHEEK